MTNPQSLLSDTNPPELEQAVIDAAYTIISQHATEREVASWQRRRKSLEYKIVNTINPVEQQIVELHMKLQPMYDDIAGIREELRSGCIHPHDMLVYSPETNRVTCKFCERSFTAVGVVDGSPKK